MSSPRRADARPIARSPRSGPALVLLAVLGLVRAGCAPPAGPFEGIDPRAAGTLIRRPLGALSGGDFRLLEGVGPVMAGRLEAARLAAGGRLDATALRRVEGVGPVRARRWSRGLAADRALR